MTRRQRWAGAYEAFGSILVPIAVYYGLRALGVGVVTALLLSAVPPALAVVYGIIARRRIDGLAAFTLVMIVIGVALSLVTGNVRFVFAKDACLSAAAGVWFLLSARGHQPAALVFSRPLLEAGSDRSWDTLWQTEPRFRRIWLVCTLIQGLGCIADSIVRLVMAYTLPIDLVPALIGAQYLVFIPLILAVTNVYQFRAGLWPLLRGGGTQQAA